MSAQWCFVWFPSGDLSGEILRTSALTVAAVCMFGKLLFSFAVVQSIREESEKTMRTYRGRGRHGALHSTGTDETVTGTNETDSRGRHLLEQKGQKEYLSLFFTRGLKKLSY